MCTHYVRTTVFRRDFLAGHLNFFWPCESDLAKKVISCFLLLAKSTDQRHDFAIQWIKSEIGNVEAEQHAQSPHQSPTQA